MIFILLSFKLTLVPALIDFTLNLLNHTLKPNFIRGLILELSIFPGNQLD
jgi:hypothetical protein